MCKCGLPKTWSNLSLCDHQKNNTSSLLSSSWSFPNNTAIVFVCRMIWSASADWQVVKRKRSKLIFLVQTAESKPRFNGLNHVNHRRKLMRCNYYNKCDFIFKVMLKNEFEDGDKKLFYREKILPITRSFKQETKIALKVIYLTSTYHFNEQSIPFFCVVC